MSKLSEKVASFKNNRNAQLQKMRWQWFRDFFGIEILKYFVVWFSIVPLALYVLKSVPEKIPFAIGAGVPVELHIGLPFNWLWLWLASVAYTAALVLYKIFCPRVIAQYHNFGDYIHQHHSPRWIAWMAHYAITSGGLETKFVQRMFKKEYLSPSAEKLDPGLDSRVDILPDCSRLVVRHSTACVEFSMPIIKEGKIDREATLEIERDVFWEVFGYYSDTNFIARCFIFLLLIVALLFFSFVLVEHIVSVFPYLRVNFLS